MPKILVSYGTRPEGIKLAPVIHELRARAGVDVVTLNVGQHGAMLDETMDAFSIASKHRLEVISPGQTLDDLTARALPPIGRTISGEQPDMVIGQGDTTTVFVTALAAFYHRVPFAHVEAGLRTHIPDLPFPEEMNRRLATALSSLHFAPTTESRANLLREGVADELISVTGNTVIDALLWMLEQGPGPGAALAPILADSRRLVVITAHRRESWGVPMEEIGAAVTELAETSPDVLFVFPIHPNPRVREAFGPAMRSLGNVQIIEPVPYTSFVHLMKRADLLLTDSGGIQEEAAALQKPVLVMRDVTERGEGLATGTSTLVGRDRSTITGAVRSILSDPVEYQRHVSLENPYGDGRAALRIADRIIAFLDDRSRANGELS
ncbi:MAG: UDP-N-acetylglucosamine 2-epimerase (non-hydrolyzing) [Actinomycetota bacterium]